MKEIEIEDLTTEQIELLEQKIAAKKRAEKERAEREIETYKDLVKHTVGEQIVSLQEVNSILSLAKSQVFGSFITLIAMKQTLFGVKAGQQGHSFSDDNGNTITLGYRIVDQYDDTINEGVSLVNEFIASLSINEETAFLVETIQKLLKKDAKGNLKPSRVIELQNMADKRNDEKLTKGVRIIRESYKPVRSAFFIEAETTLPDGTKQSVALSITSAEFHEGFELNFEVFR
jgi:hypothetical protein